MKSKLLSLIITVVAVIMLCAMARTVLAGGFDWFDTTWRFDRVMVAMPDGTVVQGPLDSWRDYEDGDQLQVEVNGVTYLTHASNVVLIKGK